MSDPMRQNEVHDLILEKNAFNRGDEAVAILAAALSHLDDEILSRVLNECAFYMIRESEQDVRCDEKAIYVSTKRLCNRSVILLHEMLLDDEDDEHAILHEVAHWYLQHEVPESSENEKERIRIEREAEEIAQKWLTQ